MNCSSKTKIKIDQQESQQELHKASTDDLRHDIYNQFFQSNVTGMVCIHIIQ